MCNEKKVGSVGPTGAEVLPLVSIVIMTRNRQKALLETLRRVQRCRYPNIEVIVVDNASEDGTAERVAEAYPGVRVIRLQENIGTTARNVGISSSSGEFVVVQDDDSFFTPASLGRAVRKLMADPRLGAVAAREITADKWEVAQHLHEWKPAEFELEKKAGRNSVWFSGCGAVLRRAALDQVGLFPEDFFWGHEEIDLATRLIIAGWEVKYYPDVVTIHAKRLASRNPDFEIYYPTRNVVWYWWRYLPLRLAVRNMVFDFLCYYSAYAIYRGAPLAYLRAVAAIVRSVPYMRSVRSPAPPEVLDKLEPYDLQLLRLLRRIRSKRRTLLLSLAHNYSNCLKRQ